ncbi:MAG: hypothetical protein J6I45_01585 [Clostridia bacterium]|nr:hypothetical protein [Clostridia bacterium]
MNKAIILPSIPQSADSQNNFILHESSDFWRLHLDTGEHRELAVHSSEQGEPVCTERENETVLVYHSLTAEDGSVHEIELELHILAEGQMKKYFSVIRNSSDHTRVNEVQFPFFDFDRLNSAPEDEVLYIPCSLGERVPNPRLKVRSAHHTEYTASDDRGIWMVHDYGGSLTMSFMGVQSGDTFLYLTRQDPEFSVCGFCVGTTPRREEMQLRLTVSQYPLVVPGETVCTPSVDAAIYLGDWRCGAAHYKAWTETWAPMPEKPDWVKNMTGWQRIIMKHQYGEIFLKYSDLPTVWREGAEYGITTLLLFGWWKGRFDNGYPVYEPDEAMGGEEGLKAAIREIQEMGGKVMLYTNGRLVDVKSDFYKEKGLDVCQIDIDGNPYLEHYRFANQGTLLRKYGYISFASPCHATDEWAEHMENVAKLKLSLGADCIFFDQIGGAINRPCFNPKHKHGNRGANEGYWRIENLDRVRALLPEDHALATENICDAFISHVHVVHGGCGGCWRTTTQYPYMFRSIFPHIILSNRMLHDSRADMRIHLNNAFVYGLIFDGSLHRCRGKSVAADPEYASYIKYLIDKKAEYARFFYDGTFVSERDYELPAGVAVAEYHHGNERMFAFMNDNAQAIEFEFLGQQVKIEVLDVACIVLSMD